MDGGVASGWWRRNGNTNVTTTSALGDDSGRRPLPLAFVADRVERITELLMLLLDVELPITFDDIVERTSLYG